MNRIRARFTLLVIFLINLSGWTGFSIFGPLVPEIACGFFIGIGLIGVIHSICFIISGFMAFLWAFLESKFTRKSLLMSALFLYSLGLLTSSFSFNYVHFLFFRIIMAVGFGAFLPLSNSIIMDLKSSEDRTKTLSLLGLTVMIGFGTSNILAGILLNLTSWRMILFILSISSMIIIGLVCVINEPSKEMIKLSVQSKLSEGKFQFSFSPDGNNFTQLLRIKSNINFLILFFIHDFVIGTISFYIVPMLKTDLQLIPFHAMVLCILLYLPQLIGAPYWGKVADHKFMKKANGKVSILILTVLIGPLFSILGYSLLSVNIFIFIICIMIFAFITPATTSIAYSILGDINPLELRTTIFSLSNFSAICGRSIGIAVCGIIYDHLIHQYSIIFLSLQVTFLFGLMAILIRPMHMIPIEMRKLTLALKQEVSATEESPNKEPKPSIKNILNTLIESQIVLFRNHLKLAQNQEYLIKFLKYSLEVSRRILLLQNKKEINLETHKYITNLKQKLNQAFEVIGEIEEI